MAEPVSLRELARRLEVSDTAIRKRIKAGGFPHSIVVDEHGRPTVVDVDLAIREWGESTRRREADGPDDPARTDEPANLRTAGSQSDAPPVDTPVGELIEASTLIEAQRLATIERARKLRLENDQTEGRLVPVERVAKEAFEADRIIRESLLNLPARLSGELAAETDAGRVFILLDRAIREALKATADQLMAVNG